MAIFGVFTREWKRNNATEKKEEKKKEGKNVRLDRRYKIKKDNRGQSFFSTKKHKGKI